MPEYGAAILSQRTLQRPLCSDGQGEPDFRFPGRPSRSRHGTLTRSGRQATRCQGRCGTGCSAPWGGRPPCTATCSRLFSSRPRPRHARGLQAHDPDLALRGSCEQDGPSSGRKHRCSLTAAVAAVAAAGPHRHLLTGCCGRAPGRIGTCCGGRVQRGRRIPQALAAARAAARGAAAPPAATATGHGAGCRPNRDPRPLLRCIIIGGFIHGARGGA